MRLWVLAAGVSLLSLAGPAHASATNKRPPLPAPALTVEPDPTTLKPEERYELWRAGRIEQARRAAARKDILGWGKALFPDKFNLPFCKELHGYFVEIRNEAFTCTEAPRGHSKTTCKCFLIPLFQALEEPESFRHYLNVQATVEKAIEINRAIKLELEQNVELREIYGDQVTLERWTDKQFRLRNGVIFTAIGAGQSIRGLNYRSIRPDYVIVDDLYDDEDINNPTATAKKNSWFWGALYKALAKGRRTSLHVQGTAINATDLLAELAEKAKADPSLKARTFQAVTSWEKKTVLWSELNTFEGLMQDKALMGTVIFMREMQNERRDDATSIVKRAWLEGRWEYDPDLLQFNENLELVAVLLGVDPSIGADTGADYTGVALIYKGKPKEATVDGSNYYIDALWNEHLSFDGRLGLLRAIKQEQLERGRPVSTANIEGIAGFKDFVAASRKTGLPVREIDKVADKITHLENKSHYFENGRVRLSKRIPEKLRDELLYQLTTNRPKHDDLRDAVLLALDSTNRLPWRPV